MERKISPWAIVFASLIIVSLFFIPFSDPAAVGMTSLSFGKPFGGKIEQVVYCTCSANFGLKIGPPRGGNFIYQPGASRLFAFFRITTVGAWTLGTASGVVPCMQYRGKTCKPDGRIPNGYLILMVGTS